MTADATAEITLSAPAKVNLGLRITGVREDGYHLLDSLFAPLDLADELSLRVRPLHAREAAGVDLSVLAETGEVPAGTDNLAARAAQRFLEASGQAIRVEIVLRKQIPVGAGLGGGSSDAAAVLRALDALAPGALDPEARRRIALSLGADVPFFLDPQPAHVTGIGERIEPVANLPALDLLLVNPGVSLATAAVYAEFDRREGALTLATARPTLRPPVGQGKVLEWLSGGQLRNDLEAAARRLCPRIGELQDELLAAGAVSTAMSGSGATVFGVFRDRAAAEAARARFGRSTWARVAAALGSR